MIESSSGFRKLTAWQKAQELAVQIILEMDRQHRSGRRNPLADQLVRSAGSIAANIAEGYGRYSPGAYRNHLSIARGSLFETESWLDLLHRTGRLSPDPYAEFLRQCVEIGKLLTTSMRGEKVPTSRIRDERAAYIVDSGRPFVDEGEEE